jgi:hypothetical protein
VRHEVLRERRAVEPERADPANGYRIYDAPRGADKARWPVLHTTPRNSQ